MKKRKLYLTNISYRLKEEKEYYEKELVLLMDIGEQRCKDEIAEAKEMLNRINERLNKK